MPTQLQLRRGTTSQNNSFTGAAGELSVDTDTDDLRLHDGSLAGGRVISVPIGAVVPYAGASAPAGYLLCDGSAVSRTTYAALFAIVGTAFGVGDGSTTFNLPDSQDRVILGKGTNNATLGAQTSSFAASSALTTASGTASISAPTGTFATSAKDSSQASAVTSVTASGHTHGLTVPSSVMNFIIKI